MKIHGAFRQKTQLAFRYWLLNKIPIGLLINYQQFRIRKNLQQHDCALVSFPKTGRTWLRVMLAHCIQTAYDLPTFDPLNLDDMVRGIPGAPLINVGHDGMPHWLEVERLPQDRQMYRNLKVSFLVRDPRDTIVSLYFHKTKRDGIPFTSPSELLHSPIGGFASMIEFYNIWWRNRTVPKDFHLIRYEDLRQDTASELLRLCTFFGLERVQKVHVDRAVEMSSFERMRQAEAADKTNIAALRAGDTSDVQSFKTREGSIGGYRKHFSAEDLAWMEDYIATHLEPAFGYGKPT